MSPGCAGGACLTVRNCPDTPPPIDTYGYGPRVPALVVSAYARPGFIDHTIYDFTSVLRLIEDQFHLASLTTRDAQAHSLAGSLTFSQTPLAPALIGAPLQ